MPIVYDTDGEDLLFAQIHRPLGPKELGDVLACLVGPSGRWRDIKLNKLSVMFNGAEGQGVGDFIAKHDSVREVCWS